MPRLPDIQLPGPQRLCDGGRGWVRQDVGQQAGDHEYYDDQEASALERGLYSQDV